MEICVENEDEDKDDHENENGEAEDNQNNENNNANGGGRIFSSSASGYTFSPSGGQECGRAGEYALSVKGFELDMLGISQQTWGPAWGYGGKQVDLLLTLSTSDEGNSHNSNDSADEGYAIGYCEITLKTGRNPPHLAIVGAATAALCSLVFYMAYKKEERKARARNNENAKDYDSMTDAIDGSHDAIDGSLVVGTRGW